MAFHAAVEELMREVTEKVILKRFQNLKDGDVEDKGGNDPVTVADRESEEMLSEGLAKIIPGLPIVGEEAAHADKSVLDRLSGDCWIVDPIDGTRNFATGKPPFGILLAMASGGEAHTGWIYDCLSGRLCTAHRGKGAFVNGEKVDARATGEASPVAAISLLFMDMGKRDRVMEHIAPHYRLVDVPYCAAEQYPRLGLGENDVSLFERTLAWDHAAGVLWLNEAGGKAARPDGSPYRVDDDPYSGLIGAASPALWEDMAKRLDAMDG
ncbi:inositol monophosphatase family protein [Alteraurantiacibacter aquimixticola]|uniref:Inositol monophosphatase n=1 Tax=Alteraurantiacibacter aquimixticola TaxID=2489173 RepID=A0A4T3F4D7_9SPHN|nr:inositol monophosphatase family protein [Alteraurantiacibacter aquimixticola]TIX52038.1 inositol monophosphatase [Alteraurantiacibacter aquimixticola]